MPSRTLDSPLDILLDPGAHPVIGHRGASSRAPENTLPAFARALEEGADALELDVHVSADDVPVVMHDPRLDRTTDATGPLAALPAARIRAADAGARFTVDGAVFPFRGGGVRVPLLDEVLESFVDVPLILEIKTARASDAVRRVLRTHDAARRVLVMSFDRAALAPFAEPVWTVGASQQEAVALLRGTMFGRTPPGVRYRALSIPSRWHGVPLPVARLARAARALGCPLHIWVVDRPARAQRLWRAGVAGIVTNAPADIRQARDREFGRA